MPRVTGWLTVLAGLGVATAATAQDATPQTPPKPKLICKRSADTGSLIAKRRECKTRAEWDRLAESARLSQQYEIDRQMTRSGGQ